MRRSTSLGKATAATAAAALLLVGCGTQPDTGGDETGGQVDADATLRVNYGELPENWAPGHANEGGPLRIVYETLLALDEDEDPSPFLASDYELTPEALTLELREGVTFHDGETFDADSVAANIQYVQESASAAASQLSVIDSVDVLDTHTVQLNLSHPTPSLPYTLTTRILPMASPAALEDGSIAQHPVGTSPWAYDDAASIPGTRLRFSQFAEYWGELPAFGNIELFAIEDDEAAAAALLSGEIDVSEIGHGVVPRLEGSDVDTMIYPAIRNNLFFFDRGPGGVFESVELRQAVCYAIDVQQMADLEAEDGLEATQHFSEGELGYNPDIEGYPTDLDRARELYEEAGSPSVNVEMVAAPYNNTQIEIFMEQASEIGDFQVTVTTLPPPQFSGEWNSGRYPLGLASNEQLTPYDWYRAWFAADAPGNPAGVESDELRAAADAAIEAGDSDEAEGLWAEVTKIISDEALTCAHAVGVEMIAWNTQTVQGLDAPTELWEPQLINYRDLVPVS